MAKQVTLSKVIVTFTLCWTLCDISPCVAYDDCNANYMQGDDVPGKCTTFFECPSLLELLKSPQKTTSEIKLLQKLTCKPDNENPLICCPVEDIVSNSNKLDYAVKGTSNKNVVSPPNDGIVFESEYKRPNANKYSIAPEKVSTTVAPIDDRKGSLHPNFNLLPPLTLCSSTAETDDRIVGGNYTSILQYPFLARIGYYSIEEDTVKYLCAGTVISKRYILTAAHCTQEIDLTSFTPVHIRVAEKDAVCSETYGCSEPIDIKIEKIIPHPNYNKHDKSNDVGLIRVAEDIPFSMHTKPVCLPFVEEYGLEEYVDPTLGGNQNVEAFVAGWGKTRWTNQEGSKHLMHVKLPIVSQTQCQKNYRNITKITISEKQLCAGGVRGKDSCGGDSGGGLFVYQKVPVIAKIQRNKMFQFGIVSFGPTHCAVGGLPGVYSLVYSYKNWILDQLKP